MNENRLQIIALRRAKGEGSRIIGKVLQLTPEHIRQHYYTKLNRMSLAEIHKLMRQSNE